MKNFRKLLKRVGPGSNDTGESGSNDTGKSNTEQNIHRIQSKHNVVKEVYGSAPSTAREAGEEFQAKKTITNNPIKESTSTPHESTEIEHISYISGDTGENARGTEVSIQPSQDIRQELSRHLSAFTKITMRMFIQQARNADALEYDQGRKYADMIEDIGTLDPQLHEEVVEKVGHWAKTSNDNEKTLAKWLQQLAEDDQPGQYIRGELSRLLPWSSDQQKVSFIRTLWSNSVLEADQAREYVGKIEGGTFDSHQRQELVEKLVQKVGDWVGVFDQSKKKVADWLQWHDIHDIADQPGMIRDISRRLPEIPYQEAEEKLELMLKITQHLLDDTYEILYGTSSIRKQQKDDLSSIVDNTYYTAIEASYKKLKDIPKHAGDYNQYIEYPERKSALLNSLGNLVDCYIETFNYKNSIDYADAIVDKDRKGSKTTFEKIGEIADRFLRPRQVERYYEAEFEKFWRKKAEKQGQSVEDCIEAEKTHIRERLIKDTRGWWRCQPETLLAILQKTGRAMTTFEPGTEPSAIRGKPGESQAEYTALRARIEVGIEGYREDLPLPLRSLGMYITDDAFGSLGPNQVDMFGPMAILWDKELLDCTKVTLSSYLPNASDGRTRLEVKLVPHSDPDIQSYPLKTPALYEKENGNVPSDYSSVHNIPFWVEGRMPVALAKKERMSLVVFRNKLDNSKLMKQLQIALDENNIPWVVMSGDKVFQHSKSYEIWLRENPNSKYRIDKSNIESALAKEPFEPKQLINTFKQNSFLKQQFEAKTGVVEGYILEDHAEMNMTQFEKYFAKKFKSPLLTKSQWRVKNALDDIGKPEAFRVTGKTSMQHKYTGSIMRELLRQLEIPPERAKIMVSLATHDYIGQYMKGEVSDPKEVATSIILEARRLNVDTDEYFELCKISYMCDAGSYTEDTGGKKSLDHLFVFNPDSETMEFSSQTREKFNELVKHTERLYMNDVGDTLLTISGRISSRHIKELNKHNIGYVVDMRSEGCDDAQELAKQNIELLHIPVADQHAPTIDQLMRATNWVNEQLNNMKNKNDRKKVLVHCTYGKGRSPQVVCAVLISQGMTAQKALDTVMKYRTQAELSPEQWERLNEFEQHLKRNTKKSTSLWKSFGRERREAQ